MSEPGSGAGVAVSGLRVSYGDVVALDGLDLTIPGGTVHAVAGPNGSGKTTLLGVLAGLVRRDAGTVRTPPGPVGYGFQRPNVYPTLSVRENLAVFGALVDAPPERRQALAERLRLTPALDRPVAALSDGYRKKLDLACAVLRDPPLVLLDEPLADLDDLTRRRLVGLVEELAGGDRVVLVSTHHLTAFAGVLDGLTVLYDGDAVADRRGDALADPAAVYGAALEDRG